MLGTRLADHVMQWSHRLRRPQVYWIVSVFVLIVTTLWVQGQGSDDVQAVRASIVQLRDDTRATLWPKYSKKLVKRLDHALKEIDKAEKALDDDRENKAKKRFRAARKDIARYAKHLKKHRPSRGVVNPLLTRARIVFDRLTALIAGEQAPANTPPMAHAGPDQTVTFGELVQLDGSGSTDADGDALDFNWGFSSLPSSSVASLSDPEAAKPSFEVDVPGNYVLRLVVNDKDTESVPDTVTINTLNSAPVADSGQDQTVLVGDTITLDGSRSSDVDGDEITYLWTVNSAPEGSQAVLSDPLSAQPVFEIDMPGAYAIQLVVNDGSEDSTPDIVSISTRNSPPVANAGVDQGVATGDTVVLDGSGSSDIDGDALRFTWSLTGIPEGSGATLSDVNSVDPSFQIDKPGAYTVQLIVNDGDEDSTPDTVTITTRNSAPLADAGPDRTMFVGETVQLDGGVSSDVDGDALTYTWSLVSIPQGSGAVLSDPTAIGPVFGVDLPGTYIAQLIVTDGELDSEPDQIVINTENSRPVADAGLDQEAVVRQTVTLDGGNSSDSDNDPLSFQWSLIAKPVGSESALSPLMQLIVNDGQLGSKPNSDQAIFIPDRAGEYLVQLLVNDGYVNSEPDAAMVKVTVPVTVNQDPRINSAPLTTAVVNEPYIYQVEASDGDGDTLSYSLDTAPAGMSIGAASGRISWTPTASGDAVVVVRVRDSRGGAITQSYTIIVAADEGETLPPDPDEEASPLDTTGPTPFSEASDFLYSGTDPIQTGMAEDTIEPVRAAIVRGQVRDAEDQPLPGVVVTVKDHLEYGQTITRSDGMFDMGQIKGDKGDASL